MAIRSHAQEAAAIWAEKKLGRVAEGKTVFLPYIYSHKAKQIAGMGVLEAARKRGYTTAANGETHLILLRPPGAVSGVESAAGGAAAGIAAGL